jgi:hypothetical protein
VRSTEVLRARLRASLHYPPPGFDPASAPKAEETPLGEDDIGTYAELRIPVLPGVQSTGLLVRPKTAHKGDRLPLVIAAAGRGGMPSASAERDPAVVAMVAPRPLLVQSGNQDQLFPITGARRAAPEAASFYARQGAAERFRFMEFVGRHDLDGDEAVRFIDQHLPPTAKRVRPPPENPEDLSNS